MMSKIDADASESAPSPNRGSVTTYINANYDDIVVRPVPADDQPPAPGPAPFKGLLPYTPSDAPLFQGRQQLVERLAQRLQESRFLALVGSAGSGKTSLIGAGLTPLLLRQNWLVETFTPTARPLHALAAALLDAEPSLATADRLVSAMVVNRRALSQAGRRILKIQAADHLLLVVDQFEELFTLCQNEAERGAFLATLLANADEREDVTVLISLNASFYDRCLQYDELRSKLVAAQEPVTPPAGRELLQLLAEPARHGKWRYVDGLMEHIVECVGQGPAPLPLLSQALYETWRRRQGRVMTFAGFKEAGGLENAIAHTGEHALDAMQPEQVELAKRILLFLVDQDGRGQHAGRKATITELTRLGRASDVASVITHLVRARLLIIDGGQVEISHEALLAHWPRLRNW